MRGRFLVTGKHITNRRARIQGGYASDRACTLGIAPFQLLALGAPVGHTLSVPTSTWYRGWQRPAESQLVRKYAGSAKGKGAEPGISPQLPHGLGSELGTSFQLPPQH